jgi:RimJ/RimL family protein N-acetyltransferase
MWRRSSLSDGIECRFGGVHAVTSPRLRVASARWSDAARSWRLNRDAEAQHWLGWTPRDQAGRARRRAGFDKPIRSSDFFGFIGVHHATRQLLAWIEVRRVPDGGYEVGGIVDPEFRGQGYGQEALQAVCRLAHGHFGVRRLLASCESTNIASQKWLIASGFTRTDGPAQHTLPNGRVIESMRWERVDESAARRCRGVTVR